MNSIIQEIVRKLRLSMLFGYFLDFSTSEDPSYNRCFPAMHHPFFAKSKQSRP